MSKTKEELKKLKEEVEAINEKLSELTEEEITQIRGGDKIKVPTIWPPARCPKNNAPCFENPSST